MGNVAIPAIPSGSMLEPADLIAYVPRNLLVADLALHLQEIADDAPDAASVHVDMSPFDILRLSRLIAPAGGNWPRPAAPSGGDSGVLVWGIAIGICGLLLVQWIRGA
jgi:hypothetical protein